MVEERGEKREEGGQKGEETQLCLCRVAPAVLGEVREVKIGRNDADKEEVCARVLIYPIRLGKRGL
jgi:hypothetical protein